MSRPNPVLTLWSRWRTDAVALLLVLVVALVPRVAALDADPPARVTGAFLSDEGWWAQNARQRVLFGAWVMDEHNPALVAAPAYTAVLALTYELAGLGLAETRLASALAGALACLLLYVGLRAVLTPERALPPALLLALSSFAILQSRLALTETVQLAFVVLGAAGVLWATRIPMIGLVGGAGILLAILSKPNAVILGPVLLAFWGLEYRQARRDGEPMGDLVHQVASFALAMMVGTCVVLVLLAWPHWAMVREQLAVSLANVYSTNRRLADGGVLIFLLPFLSLRPSQLFLSGVVPMLGLLALLWRRLARPSGPLDAAERLAWLWWWGVLAYLATQSYQPDRRYLLLAPALAILGARGLFEREAGAPSVGVSAPAPTRLRLAGAGAAVGALAGLLAMGYGIPPLAVLFSRLPLGGEDGISLYALQLGVWHLVVTTGAVLAWRGRMPAGWRVPRGLWVALFLLLEPLPLGWELLRPTYTERETARAIATVARTLPPERRVMTGFLANSLALESDIFAFYIRDEPAVGARQNLDGWDRFRPTLAVTAARGTQRVGLPLDPAGHGLRPLCRFPLWREVGNGDPLVVTLWFTREAPPPPCPAPGQPVP